MSKLIASKIKVPKVCSLFSNPMTSSLIFAGSASTCMHTICLRRYSHVVSPIASMLGRKWRAKNMTGGWWWSGMCVPFTQMAGDDYMRGRQDDACDDGRTSQKKADTYYNDWQRWSIVTTTSPMQHRSKSLPDWPSYSTRLMLMTITWEGAQDSGIG